MNVKLSASTGRVARWLDRAQPSETVVLSVAALLVGLLSGIGVWIFKDLIELAHRLFYDGLGAALSPLGGWTIALVTVAGGLVVGLIMHFFVGEERHHGVAGIMEAVALAGGRLRYKRAPVKVIAASISIGAGASVGPEDPSVQIGANLGSMFGQILHLSDDQVRALVSAGAAGGIAAAFNAPIAGVFFALEIIVGELSVSLLGGVVLASVVSAVFIQAVSGSQPAFHIPAYEFHSVRELALYAVLGLLAGPVAALYIRTLYFAQDAFHSIQVPRWLKPAIAGVFVGVTGLFLPQILGVGYSTIEQILGGEQFPVTLLIALLVAKLLMTSISIGGGFVGGVFAPSLFLGATLGAAFGTVAGRLLPGWNIQSAAFAMVGMAAVLAGTVHAPLTAILLIFEMTNDYRVILPLMFAVMISLLVAQRLQRDSVYTLGLARKGIRLQRGRDIDVLEGLTVSEVMQAEPQTLRESDPLSIAVDTFAQTRHHGLPVVNATGELVGILTVQDIDRSVADDTHTQRTIGAACTREILTAYPDENIGAALRRMSTRDIGRLPVVSRDNPRHLIGMLRRTDLVRAYDIALARRATLRQQAQEVRLGTFGDVHIEEIVVEPNAPCANRRLGDVKWPRDCIIATLRRGRQVIVPHGDTVLKAGDVLVIAANGPAREAAFKLCSTPPA